jgi:hypothetical protein
LAVVALLLQQTPAIAVIAVHHLYFQQLHLPVVVVVVMRQALELLGVLVAAVLRVLVVMVMVEQEIRHLQRHHKVMLVEPDW